MAEAPDSKESTGFQSSKNSTSVETINAFCAPRDGIRVMKRPREDETHVANASDDAEPEEKRPSFRLNPPTLIHGQAKSVPKEEESVTESAPKRNFLRPSTLSAPAASSITSALPVFSSADKPVPSITQAPLIGSSLLLTGQVPSSNPFLKTSEEEEKVSKDQFLFQSTIEHRVKENGMSKKPGENDDVQPAEAVNGTEENVFLQMSSQANATADSKETEAESGGFVFGRKMEERVMKNEADSTSVDASQSEVNEKSGSSGFLFGKNLSDRVKVTTADTTNNLFSTQPAESVIFQEPQVNAATDGVSSSTSNRKLEEDAAALFAASNTKPVMPEVEVKTGEEDEKNVLQIQCKLFQYESASQNWVERGRGNLRLNDKRLSSSDHVFQSRLVMRTHGSLRLVLNTKIWASMIVDKASQKSVRISAQNEDGDIGVYLIMATINDAEQIYRAVEYRVLHLKQVEERNTASKRISEASSDCADSPGVSNQQTESGTGNEQGSKESVTSSDDVEACRPDNRVETTTTIKSNKQKESDAVTSTIQADDDCGSGDNGTCDTHEPSERIESEEKHSDPHSVSEVECLSGGQKELEQAEGEN